MRINCQNTNVYASASNKLRINHDLGPVGEVGIDIKGNIYVPPQETNQLQPAGEIGNPLYHTYIRLRIRQPLTSLNHWHFLETILVTIHDFDLHWILASYTEIGEVCKGPAKQCSW
jgi:hypothetical protein